MDYFSSFGTSSDYHELNSGPHRRSVIKLAPPLLSWHLSFWAWQSPNVDGEDDSTELRRRGIKSTVDTFIIAFFNNLKVFEKKSEIWDLHISSVVRDKLILFNTVYTFPSLDQAWSFDQIYGHDKYRRDTSHLNSRQQDVFDSVYRDIIIVFKWRTSTIHVRIELSTEYFTISTFAELSEDNSKIGVLRKVLDDHRLFPADDCPYISGDDLAGIVRDHLFTSFWKAYKDKFLTGSILDKLHGEKEQAHPVFGHAFADFRGLVISDQSTPYEHDNTENWGAKATEYFMPILAGTDQYECAANYMLDGRALYMSTLGPQNPRQDEASRIPVFYFICVKACVNKLQIGRLIVRIHHLGSMRLASLRQFKGLLRSGQVLAELEPIIKDARSLITNENNTEAIPKIVEANRKFDEISKIEKSILYRIERSKYYKLQFAKNVPALRIGRIEGFQQYDHFVERRMGAALDFIDRLGDRYQRASTNLSLLQQYYLSITANSLARAGEAALFIILIPYYLSSLLLHFGGKSAISFAYAVSIISMVIGGARFFIVETHFKSDVQNIGRATRRFWIRVRQIAQVVALPLPLSLLPLFVDNQSLSCFKPLAASSLQCYFSYPLKSAPPAAD